MMLTAYAERGKSRRRAAAPAAERIGNRQYAGPGPLLCSFRGWLHYQYSANTRFSVSPFAYFTNYPVIQNTVSESAKPFREICFSAAVDNRNKITGKWILLERNALEYHMPDNGTARMRRLRNRFGVQYPVTSQLGLSVYDALFCNIAGASPAHFFDHNRVGVMMEYKIAHEIKLETGYIYIRRLPFTSDVPLTKHNIMLNFTFRFKNKKARIIQNDNGKPLLLPNGKYPAHKDS